MLEDQPAVHSRSDLLRSLSNEKRWLLFVYFPVSLLVYLVGSTLLEYYQPGIGKVFDIIFAIISNVIVFAWCRLDSRERGYKLHRLFAYATVIVGILALIYYLLRSRDFPAGLAAIGWLIVYIICCYVPVVLVSLVIFIILIATGLVSPNVLS